MYKFFALSLVAFQINVATQQCVGRQPLSYSAQIPETAVESPVNCQQVQFQPAVIESPTNANQRQVTLITDCTPSVCKNLANTIQLMIVVDLLKNGKGANVPVEMALPLLNEINSSPAFSCGCQNPFFSNGVANVKPNVLPNIPSNFIPNSFFPNFQPSNAISGIIPGIFPFNKLNPNPVF